jgi:hypothetical protein
VYEIVGGRKLMELLAAPASRVLPSGKYRVNRPSETPPLGGPPGSQLLLGAPPPAGQVQACVVKPVAATLVPPRLMVKSFG